MKPELIQISQGAAPAQGLSRAELDRYLRRAHCLRAVAFSRLVERIARGLSALYRGFKQARDRRSAIAELRRLDRRMLKDIGVERSQVPLIIEQLLRQPKAKGEPPKAYRLRSLRALPTPGADAEDDERCPPLAA
jgi:uncharacterized protein YjiS (DUF1127 family)